MTFKFSWQLRKKKLLDTKCVFWFPLQLFFSETFLLLRTVNRDMIKTLRWSINCSRYSCHILMKLEFSWQIFEKYSNIEFRGNRSSGSRVVPCGRTDRRTEMTKIVVNFISFAKASKKYSLVFTLLVLLLCKRPNVYITNNAVIEVFVCCCKLWW